MSTEKGIQPLSTVRAGQLILTPRGYHPVVEARSASTRLVYTVTLSDGRQLRATSDQLFLAPSLTYKPLCEFRLGERMFISTVRASAGVEQTLPKSVRHPQQKKSVRLPEVLDRETAFVLGWFIAEGCFCPKEYRLIFAYARGREEDIANRIADWIRLRGLEPKFGGRPDTGSAAVSCASMGLFIWFVELCGGVSLSRARRTPPVIWPSTPAVRAAYLRGLITGDGLVQGVAHAHSRKPSGRVVGYCSYSRELARETQILLLSLGVPAYLRECDAFGNKGGKWSVFLPAHYLARFAEAVGLAGHKADQLIHRLEIRGAQKRRRENVPNRSTDRWLRAILDARQLFDVEIRSVVPAAEAEVSTVIVQEEHCFLANGVVTHE